MQKRSCAEQNGTLVSSVSSPGSMWQNADASNIRAPSHLAKNTNCKTERVQAQQNEGYLVCRLGCLWHKPVRLNRDTGSGNCVCLWLLPDPLHLCWDPSIVRLCTAARSLVLRVWTVESSWAFGRLSPTKNRSKVRH